MDFNILLLSAYEMGRQPHSLALSMAALEQAGFQAAGCDLSVRDFPEEGVRRARLVAISAPMHTALRLGVESARRVRDANPGAHICFTGHYAYLNEEYLLEEDLADSVLAGEYENALVRLASDLLASGPLRPAPRLERFDYAVPLRSGLPGLEEYARLEIDGETRLAGYTETTRGCLHSCTHCPVVPVYEGRFFAVPVRTVMADIRQQVEAGARHITFGDPDFLNGPTHALRVARALQAGHPGLTFDFTAKVEHLIAHQDLLPELVDRGAVFAVSAFESTSDLVLERLQKGHCRGDLDRVLDLCAGAGLPLRPTWVAFTPWTTYEDYLAMLSWVRARRLVGNIPAVQYAVRLLVPPKSALLRSEAAGAFDELLPSAFSHTWRHPDPRMDELHRRVVERVEAGCGCDELSLFEQIEALAHEIGGTAGPTFGEALAPVPVPRLTENWFC